MKKTIALLVMISTFFILTDAVVFTKSSGDEDKLYIAFTSSIQGNLEECG